MQSPGDSLFRDVSVITAKEILYVSESGAPTESCQMKSSIRSPRSIDCQDDPAISAYPRLMGLNNTSGLRVGWSPGGAVVCKST
jgi:hypothetical protein